MRHVFLDPALLPTAAEFRRVCFFGHQALALIRSEYRANPSSSEIISRLTEPAYPPSYEAFNRWRLLAALTTVRSLSPHRVFEVGAGAGFLAMMMRADGCQVVVNDRRDRILQVLGMSDHGETIGSRIGNIFEVDPRETGTFDLVVATELVEHVAHPDRLFHHLRGFLTPGGRLFITTPNGEYCRNQLPRYSQITDTTALEPKQFMPDADGHLFLFTPSELASLLEQCGYRIEHLSMQGTPLLNGYVMLHHLASPSLVGAVWKGERAVQAMPVAFRRRLCTHMSAIARRV